MTTERLHFHFSLSCIGEGNGNPLQCSWLENPRDGGAWCAAVYGVTQSWTRLKWLSSSSSKVFLPGEFHGQRILVGYSPWVCKELGMIKQLTLPTQYICKLQLIAFVLFIIYQTLIQRIYMWKLIWRISSHRDILQCLAMQVQLESKVIRIHIYFTFFQCIFFGSNLKSII